MRKGFVYLILLATISFTSCEKSETDLSVLTKTSIIFDKTYSDINYVPQRIVISNENDFFLFGWGYVIKVDEDGNKLWSINIENVDLAPTSDGGCIIASIKIPSGTNERVSCLTKITSSGIIEWEKRGSNYNLSQVIVGPNDEIFGVGDVEVSYYINKPKFFTYSKNGDLLSSKVIRTNFEKISYQTTCMVKLSNDRFVIGTMNNISLDRENYDFNIIEFGLDDSLVSEKHFGGFKNEYLLSIFETPDNGLILTGYSLSKDGDVKSFKDELSTDCANGWVVKLDNERFVEWEKIMGGTNSSTYFYKATFLKDNYLIGFNTEATDVDFCATDRPKSGYIIFDKTGKMTGIRYVGVWSVDCEFNNKGELQILSSSGDQYYGIYNPRLVKI